MRITALVRIVALMVAFAWAGAVSPSAADSPSGTEAAQGGKASFTLCDLVEEALLATAPKPNPAQDLQERRERRANIERIKRRVQQLRDEGRCP